MRPASLVRLLPCLAACGALALATSGCGSSATLDPVAQAAQATEHAGGSRIAMTASFTAPALPTGPISLDGGGYYNYRAREGSFSFTISGLPTAQLAGGSLKMDERIKGTTAYVGSDLFAGKLPGGARWAKIDLARFGATFGLSAQQLAGGQSNPAALLEYLKASSGGVELIGHDRVRGVATTRYRGSLDLAKLVDKVPESLRSQARAALSKLTEKTGTSSLPVEVWIDGQNRVRRLTMSMSVSESGQSVTVAIKVELFGYGPTPTVQAPADRETYDLTSAALGQLGK